MCWNSLKIFGYSSPEGRDCLLHSCSLTHRKCSADAQWMSAWMLKYLPFPVICAVPWSPADHGPRFLHLCCCSYPSFSLSVWGNWAVAGSPETHRSCSSQSLGLWPVDMALLQCLNPIWGDMGTWVPMTAILPLQEFSSTVFKTAAGGSVEGYVLGPRSTWLLCPEMSLARFNSLKPGEIKFSACKAELSWSNLETWLRDEKSEMLQGCPVKVAVNAQCVSFPSAARGTPLCDWGCWQQKTC